MLEIEDKVDRKHIEKRVNDWKKRVSDLYSTIRIWLRETDYTLRQGPKSTMYEELMSQFGMPATEVETADVYKDKTFILTIKPKGLWIIGANGRIDILSTKGSFMLIDQAEQFQTPQWKLLAGDSTEIELNKKVFLNLLK